VAVVIPWGRQPLGESTITSCAFGAWESAYKPVHNFFPFFKNLRTFDKSQKKHKGIEKKLNFWLL